VAGDERLDRDRGARGAARERFVQGLRLDAYRHDRPD
jgi:hypothetical protein